MNLEPKNLDEFIGQDKIKNSIKVSLQASKMRKEPYPHMLLYGGSGLGKTTLANIIADEFGTDIYTYLAPSMDSTEEMFATLRDMKNNSFIFIDEIHALSKKLQEMLLTVMTDFKLEASSGYRFDIPKFTFVGATTNLGQLSEPFISRFGFSIQLEKYSLEEIQTMVELNAKRNKLKVSPDAILKIARVSRSNPRTANRILQRCRDTSTVMRQREINVDIVNQTLVNLQIDHNGLTTTDLLVLNTLAFQFDFRPTGLKNLSLATNIDERTIEQYSEPLLVEMKLLERTTRGRVLTRKGIEYVA